MKEEQTKISGIYALLFNNKVIYVGQSTNIHKRYKQHCSIFQNSGNNKRHLAISKMLRNGLKPDLMILETECDLDKQEIYWIKHYRALGQVDLNTADGGKSFAHGLRAKRSYAWGKTHSPIQRRLNHINQTIKILDRLGYSEGAERLRGKLLVLHDRLKQSNRHAINNRLWEKYGW